MARIRLARFSHLPEEVQEMFELEENERIDYFFDEFYNGGPVVLGKTVPESEEQRELNRRRVYRVAGEIINEIAEAEAGIKNAASGSGNSPQAAVK